jgi:hypothetical protein
VGRGTELGSSELSPFAKNAVVWDVTPRGSCKIRSFEGTYRLNHQGDKDLRAKKNFSKTSNFSLINSGRGNWHWFDVLTAVTMRRVDFCVVTPSNLSNLDGNRSVLPKNVYVSSSELENIKNGSQGRISFVSPCTYRWNPKIYPT